MAFVWADRVGETTTTTGTGTLTLAGALTGYQSFTTIGDGNSCCYLIEAVDGDGLPTGAWEVGLGTYSTGGSLTRAAVASSNAGANVNLAAGTKRVFVVLPAERLTNHCYYGRSTDSITPSSTTWSDIHNIVSSITDVANASITRSSSQINFTRTGLYYINMQLATFNTNAYIGLRLRRTNNTATTLVKSAGYATGTSQTSPATMSGIFNVSSLTDTIKMQYVLSGTAGTFTSATHDSEATATFSVTVMQVTHGTI